MADEITEHRTPEGDQSMAMGPWGSAAVLTKIKPSSVERALFMGRNIRVKFPEAFIAGYDTVTAGMSIAAAMAVHLTWPQALWDAYNATRSVFSVLVEDMEPLAYLTAVVISQHKEGLDKTALAKEVSAFLNDPKTAKFGVCLGVTEAMLELARSDCKDGWLEGLVPDLIDRGFMVRDGDLLRYRQKNVEWSIAI